MVRWSTGLSSFNKLGLLAKKQKAVKPVLILVYGAAPCPSTAFINFASLELHEKCKSLPSDKTHSFSNKQVKKKQLAVFSTLFSEYFVSLQLYSGNFTNQSSY